MVRPKISTSTSTHPTWTMRCDETQSKSTRRKTAAENNSKGKAEGAVKERGQGAKIQEKSIQVTVYLVYGSETSTTNRKNLLIVCELVLVVVLLVGLLVNVLNTNNFATALLEGSASNGASSSSIIRIRIQESSITRTRWSTIIAERPPTLLFDKGQSSSSLTSSSAAAATTIMASLVKSADFYVASDDDDDCDDDQVASLSLLNEWKHHDGVEFHYFSSKEAAEIRAALLSWYHSNRRKLPWRGDAPPWDGSTSTAVSAAAATASSNKRKKASSKTASRKKINKTTEHDSHNVPDGASLAADDRTTTSSDTDGAFAITAYGVWVSEIMLQQTRVEAVIDYWVRWMQSFPTVDALAAASEEQVNAHWAGLGFYRRARMLHQASKVVVEQHDSELPRTVSELMQLPGIGRYTASAIASIAYNVAVPVVDGNVCRVLARLRGIANHIKEPVFKDKWAWTLAEQIVNSSNSNNGVASAPVNNNECDLQAGNVNQAIMELGATYCSPSGTGMDPNDPLKDYYWSTRIAKLVATTMSSSPTSPATTSTANGCCKVCCNGGIDQALETLQNLILEVKDNQKSGMLDEVAVAPLGHKVFPLPPPKPVRREEVLAVAAISMTMTTSNDSNDHERWLLVKRPPTGLLAGQWEFPSACIWTSSDDKSVNKKNQQKQQQLPPHFAVTPRRKALKGLLREIMTQHNSGVGGGQPALSLVSSDDLTNKLHGDSNIHQLSSSSTSSKGGQKRNQDADPLVHIFSHVRHTMWIEQVQVIIDDTDSDDDDDEDNGDDPKQQQQLTMEWIDSTGRQARWMNRKDMQQVGVTSGVKKILAAVVKARNRLTISDESSSSKTRVAKKQSPKKRQRKR